MKPAPALMRSWIAGACLLMALPLAAQVATAPRSQQVVAPTTSTTPAADTRATSAPYAANDAPVLIVLGQSNAAGRSAISDPAELAARRGLPNVLSLSRFTHTDAYLDRVEWTPYYLGRNNLAEPEASGQFVNVAGEFALQWQAAINAPRGTPAHRDLPNLHVIHIAWGAQGFSPYTVNNRWWPERFERDPESLYPFTQRVLVAAMESLRQQGKVPRVVGLHWNQWEDEVHSGWITSPQMGRNAFHNMLERFRTTLGGAPFPIWVYMPRSTAYTTQVHGGNSGPVDNVRAGIGQLGREAGYQLMDPAEATDATGRALYQAAQSPNFGIFSGDGVHYADGVQRWFARRQWAHVFTEGALGTPITAARWKPWSRLPAVPAIRAPRRDFNADNRTDLVFREWEHRYGVMLLDGTRTLMADALRNSPIGAPWQFLTHADLDGDARSEQVFIHPQTRALKALKLLTYDTFEVRDLAVPGNWAADLSFVGVARLTPAAGAGQPARDELIWHAPGSATWIQQSVDWANATVLHSQTLARLPGDWSLHGIADFDGDGADDLLWWHGGSSRYTLWTRVPARPFDRTDSPVLWQDQATPLTNPGSGDLTLQPHAGYRIAAISDLNGDKKADILWTKPDANPRFVVWQMDGNRASGALMQQPGAGWMLVDAGDYDGDGKGDLLWHHPSALRNILWLMNGANLIRSSTTLMQIERTWALVPN